MVRIFVSGRQISADTSPVAASAPPGEEEAREEAEDEGAYARSRYRHRELLRRIVRVRDLKATSSTPETLIINVPHLRLRRIDLHIRTHTGTLDSLRTG